MSYETEAIKKQLTVNTVVEVNGYVFAKHQPDNGLIVPQSQRCLKNPRINGVSIDVRNVSTPIATFSFQLTENSENPVISSLLMQDETQFLEKEVVVKQGFITGSFAYADYKEIARTRITKLSRIANGYQVTTQEATSFVNREALNLNEILRTSILSGSTTLDIGDATGWPTTGFLRIDEEFLAYNGIVSNTLQNLTRGVLGTTASSHSLGAEVFYVTIVEDVNPLTFFLQVLLSKLGDNTNDATYDVLPNGLGIAPSLVDVSGIETLRTDFFTSELQDFYVYDNDSILKYLERTVLKSTNTRLVTIDGKISLALLDQVDFESDIPLLDESSIIGTPSWELSSDKIVNVVKVFFDYNVANGVFESEATYSDADSIASFGEKKPLVLELEGVTTANNGVAIAAERANRLLARLRTPRGFIKVTSHFNAALLNAGGNVQLIHKYLPQQGGTLGFSDRLEIMSKDFDLEAATVTTRLEFTSYTGIRIAFIAPSPRIVSSSNVKTITVDDASRLKVGYTIRLFKDGENDLEGNPTAGSYLPDAVNIIESIEGNVVTFVNEFVSVLDDTITVKMADYDNASEDQKARYAFIGNNAGFFSDGSKSYQIIF